MKLKLEQLTSSLEKALAPTYLVAGDEVLLVDEALAAIRARARATGVDERDSHAVGKTFDWNALQTSLASLSLFSAGKLVELRFAKPAVGDDGSRQIRGLAGRAADGNVVVIVTPTLDRRTLDSAWVNAIAENGAVIDIRRPALADLPRWIAVRLKRHQLSCDDEGLELLASRTEGNLLAAQQEIEKLALLYPTGTRLTAAEIGAAVADGARFDVFQLGDAALAGDIARATRILDGLREEGIAAPLVLWALAREAVLLADAGVRAAAGTPIPKAIEGAGGKHWRIDLYARALKGRRPGEVRQLLTMTGRADQVVKGARPGEPWGALLELTLAVAGQSQLVAELA